MAWQKYRNDENSPRFYCAFFDWNLKLRVCMTFDNNGFYDSEGKKGVNCLLVSPDRHLMRFKVTESYALTVNRLFFLTGDIF